MVGARHSRRQGTIVGGKAWSQARHGRRGQGAIVGREQGTIVGGNAMSGGGGFVNHSQGLSLKNLALLMLFKVSVCRCVDASKCRLTNASTRRLAHVSLR